MAEGKAPPKVSYTPPSRHVELCEWPDMEKYRDVTAISNDGSAQMHE